MGTETAGVKYDQGKTRYELLPSDALELVAQVFTFGAEKYGDRNWEKGIDPERFFGAAQRHLWATARGEWLDPESARPHLAHAIASLLMELSLTLRDRPLTGSVDSLRLDKTNSEARPLQYIIQEEEVLYLAGAQGEKCPACAVLLFPGEVVTLVNKRCKHGPTRKEDDERANIYLSDERHGPLYRRGDC